MMIHIGPKEGIEKTNWAQNVKPTKWSNMARNVETNSLNLGVCYEERGVT